MAGKPPVTDAAGAKGEVGPTLLEAQRLFKIFADDPAPALRMLKDGQRKDAIQEASGVVVGVDDASFTVRKGEIFVVMGLSGSGKSTLVRLLNRLVEPSAGAVMLDGRDLTTMSRRELIEVRRRQMSMVFQSFALMPHLDATDNAAFGLALAGLGQRQRRELARAALAKVGLEASAGRHPHEMSGGMQQRVGLARALAKNPSILFMDEAFSALDPLIRTEMQDELLRLQKDERRTIVFISHDLDEAMRIGDRIAIMESGRIVQIGTPIEILLRPADAYVASFFKNVDVAKVLRARDVATAEAMACGDDEEPAAVLRRLDEAGRPFVYLTDASGRHRAVLARDTLAEGVRRQRPRLGELEPVVVPPVSADTRLALILKTVAHSACPVPVVDAGQRLVGTLSRGRLLDVLHREP